MATAASTDRLSCAVPEAAKREELSRWAATVAKPLRSRLLAWRPCRSRFLRDDIGPRLLSYQQQVRD
jgi:hypothetical protein